MMQWWDFSSILLSRSDMAIIPWFLHQLTITSVHKTGSLFTCAPLIYRGIPSNQRDVIVMPVQRKFSDILPPGFFNPLLFETQIMPKNGVP